MVAMYERALEKNGKAMATIKQEQLSDPTPCTDWDLKALVNHIIGEQHMWAATSQGPLPEGAELPNFAEDPVRHYEDSAKVALDTFRSPGIMEKTFALPIGETPGSATMAIALEEALIHGWDLATATSQDTSIDDEAAAAIFPFFENLGPELREGPNAAYGPKVDVPADAPIGQRLLGLLGRTL